MARLESRPGVVQRLSSTGEFNSRVNRGGACRSHVKQGVLLVSSSEYRQENRGRPFPHVFRHAI